MKMVDILLEMRYEEEKRVQYNQEEEEYHLLVKTGSNNLLLITSHISFYNRETKKETINNE